MQKYNVAIVGCRGAVGLEMFKILKERNFPYDQLKLISTSIDKDTTDIIYLKDLLDRQTEKFGSKEVAEEPPIITKRPILTN